MQKLTARNPSLNRPVSISFPFLCHFSVSISLFPFLFHFCFHFSFSNIPFSTGIHKKKPARRSVVKTDCLLETMFFTEQVV